MNKVKGVPIKDGNVLCTAVATFELSVPADVDKSIIRSKLEEMITKNAGITSLTSLMVSKHA
jgi:hypothetical protein|tara:strand:- start:1158 stop:1343 length:186 start_codon:yes stop_codon:yes gene_type:complete